MLIDVLYESRRKGERVMVFCNTVSSCRAVEHALKEVRQTLHALSLDRWLS